MNRAIFIFCASGLLISWLLFNIIVTALREKCWHSRMGDIRLSERPRVFWGVVVLACLIFGFTTASSVALVVALVE